MIACMICHEHTSGSFVGHRWERGENYSSHYFCLKCATDAWSKNTQFMKPNVCLVCTTPMDTENQFNSFANVLAGDVEVNDDDRNENNNHREQIIEYRRNDQDGPFACFSAIGGLTVLAFIFLLIGCLHFIEDRTSYTLDNEGNLYLRLFLTNETEGFESREFIPYIKVYTPLFVNATRTEMREFVENARDNFFLFIGYHLDVFVEIINLICDDLSDLFMEIMNLSCLHSDKSKIPKVVCQKNDEKPFDKKSIMDLVPLQSDE